MWTASGFSTRPSRISFPITPAAKNQAARSTPKPRGHWDTTLIHAAPTTVLPTEALGPHALRYLQVLPERPGEGPGEWFLARSGKYRATGGFSTWRIHRQPSVPPLQVLDDNSISHNLAAAYDPRTGRLHLYGGEYWEHPTDDRDGIRHLTVGSLAELEGGALAGSAHGRATERGTVVLRGDTEGCVTERHSEGWCEFDGKVSVVIRDDGETLLYVRQNHKYHGGRYVGVARAPEPSGSFSRIDQIAIPGWDPRGSGNLYFAAVSKLGNVLLGLFAVNEGIPGESNGDGPSYTALAASCDGVNWSALLPLVWSTGRNGRTLDQPVDGVLRRRDGNFVAWVQANVPYIADDWESSVRVDEYALDGHALREWARTSTHGLAGCDGVSLGLIGPPISPPAPPSSPPLALQDGADPNLGGCDHILALFLILGLSAAIAALAVAVWRRDQRARRSHGKGHVRMQDEGAQVRETVAEVGLD